MKNLLRKVLMESPILYRDGFLPMQVVFEVYYTEDQQIKQMVIFNRRYYPVCEEFPAGHVAEDGHERFDCPASRAATMTVYQHCYHRWVERTSQRFRDPEYSEVFNAAALPVEAESVPQYEVGDKVMVRLTIGDLDDWIHGEVIEENDADSRRQPSYPAVLVSYELDKPMQGWFRRDEIKPA